MSAPGETLSGRMRRGLHKLKSDPYQWFVLVGDRLVVAGLLTAVFTLLVLVLVAVDVVRVHDSSDVIYLAQGLLAGNVTLVTIVLSINQLVLSRELRSPGELQEQIGNVLEYRADVEETIRRSVVPPTPADFLATVLHGTWTNAQRLGGVVSGSELVSDGPKTEIDDLVATISDHTAHISDVLEASQEGIFSSLAVTLETNYSQSVHEARRIQSVYEDELTPSAHAVLDDLVESLLQIDVARQYFKTIYMQVELATLSRVLLYVGLPAIGSSILMFLFFIGGPNSAVPPDYLEGLVVAVVALGFAPLAVLFSFVLRISVVAQRTVAITPFTTPEQEIGLSVAESDERADQRYDSTLRG